MTPPGAGRPLLKAVDLSRHHRRAVETIHAVDGVSIQLERGETVAVMGPSGSGKTTLLQLLAGLDRPTSGRVEWNGEDLGSMGERRLASLRSREMGFVFQDFGMLQSLTALDQVNLALILSVGRPDPERAARSLHEVGLGDRLSHLPRELSRGEMQRVAVARALVHGPSLLFADEPTGSLDDRASAQIRELFASLGDGDDLTVVVATHDTRWVEQADRVVQLEGGRLVARSEPA